MTDRLLEAARRLHALARTGLHYCSGEYDRERYEAIERIAAELLADPGPGAAAARVLELWSREAGYVTPKVEVRGAVFRGAAVLLVRERADGLWTLPGGWADVGETPSQAVTREIEQESGIRSRAIALAALLDTRRQGRPGLFHSWKAMFLCEMLGGEPRGSYETDAAEFFDVERLPPMSLGRSTPAQVARLHEHWRKRPMPADFD